MTFEAAVAQHQHRVFTYAYYLLGSRPDAEEVTQDVLVRLWRHHRELPAHAVEPWAIRVTRNACIDWRRRRSTARKVFAGAPLPENAVDDGVDAAEALLRQELGETMRAAISGLAEPLRSVVVLREIEQMAYKDIAEALDLPLNSVKVYLHRGRKKLREALREKVVNGEI